MPLEQDNNYSTKAVEPEIAGLNEGQQAMHEIFMHKAAKVAESVTKPNYAKKGGILNDRK